MRVAAYDCGTNSLRLLVADIDAEGEIELFRDMRIVRLGEGVDRTGEISEAAMERVLGAVDDFVAVAADLGVERSRFCATSAARDARNAAVFMSEVERRVGVRPEVLTGDEEAALSFGGAVSSAGDRPQPYLVVDVGGGSTEFIVGADSVVAARSLNIGSVRLTERHFHSDPPSEGEIAAARADVDAALDTLIEAGIDLERAATVIGVAGSVTTIAAETLALETYDRDRIHGADLDVDEVRAACDRLLRMTTHQRRDRGYMHPGRADVIAAGGVILERLLQRTRVGAILVSERDILDGIAGSIGSDDRSG